MITWRLGPRGAVPSRWRLKTILGGFALLTATACSSSYVPARSPRIAIALDDGGLAFYKNGTEYEAGVFLGGVKEVVKGNPRAEDEARTAQQLVIGGYSCQFAALGASGAGFGVLSSSHRFGDTDTNVGLGLLAGSAILNLVGAVLEMNAVPHVYDAVNIYNDGVPPYAGTPSFVAPPPGAAPPTNPFMMPAPPSAPR